VLHHLKKTRIFHQKDLIFQIAVAVTLVRFVFLTYRTGPGSRLNLCLTSLFSLDQTLSTRSRLFNTRKLETGPSAFTLPPATTPCLSTSKYGVLFRDNKFLQQFLSVLPHYWSENYRNWVLIDINAVKRLAFNLMLHCQELESRHVLLQLK